MALDEEKVIEDLENSSIDGLKDYANFVKSNAEFRFRRQQQKLVFGTMLLAVYLLFVLGVLSLFRNNTAFLLWPFMPSGSSDSQQLSKLQEQISSLQSEVAKLSTATSTPKSANIGKLDARMEALEESINLDPEKALTAGLIREQQKNLEANFAELRDAQTRLEDKFGNFVTTVLITPIVGALLALLVWFIQARMSRKER